MKKVMALLIALSLLTVPGYSDGIDLSGLTLDELVELANHVREEIETRTEWNIHSWERY